MADPDRTFCRKQVDVANALGRTASQVSVATRDPTFPERIAGKGWDLEECRAWFSARARAPDERDRIPVADRADKQLDPDSKGALTRWRVARAKAAELDAKKKERELIPAKEVAELLQRWAVSFRAALLAVPGRLSDRLSVEQRAALQSELMALLTSLYEMRDEWAKEAG